MPLLGIAPLPSAGTVFSHTGQEQSVWCLGDIEPIVCARRVLLSDADHRRRTEVSGCITSRRAAEHQTPPRRCPKDVVGRVVTWGTENDVASDTRRTARIIAGRWFCRGQRRDHHRGGVQHDRCYIDSHYDSVPRSPGNFTISVLRKEHWFHAGSAPAVSARPLADQSNSCCCDVPHRPPLTDIRYWRRRSAVGESTTALAGTAARGWRVPTLPKGSTCQRARAIELSTVRKQP